MTNDRCEWCEAPALSDAPDGGGERLCAECFAACVPEDVDSGERDAADDVVTRSRLSALQFKGRSGALPFDRETVRARRRP